MWFGGNGRIGAHTLGCIGSPWLLLSHLKTTEDSQEQKISIFHFHVSSFCSSSYPFVFSLDPRRQGSFTLMVDSEAHRGGILFSVRRKF